MVNQQACTLVAHHAGGLVLCTGLGLSAWQPKRGLLCAPWLLAALVPNINLQAPQNTVAICTILQALLVTRRCLYKVDQHAWTLVAHHVSGLVLQTELVPAAWEAETRDLHAPGPLTARGNNIHLPGTPEQSCSAPHVASTADHTTLLVQCKRASRHTGDTPCQRPCAPHRTEPVRLGTHKRVASCTLAPGSALRRRLPAHMCERDVAVRDK